jgi:hypothetical protein
MFILRHVVGRLPIILLVLLFSACGAEAPAAVDPAAVQPIAPVLAASELTVGLNRLPIGLLQGGTPLNDPQLSLPMRIFYVGPGGDRTVPVAETTAVYRAEGLPLGLYVAYANLEQVGGYEAEIVIDHGGTAQTQRIRLDVVARGRALPVGAEAYPSENLTSADMPNLAELTSDPRPEPAFYELSVADAIAAGKPVVVAFSTPGYCQTAVCAPNMLVLKTLYGEYGRQVQFVHVEVYPYPFGEAFSQGRRVPAMDEWGLLTEPWTYLINADGVIEARYEGGITLSELRPALAQLAVGQPVDPSQ